MNLAEALDFHARSQPDKVALIKGDEVIDYRSFAARVRGCARRLHAAGLEPGALVGVCVKDTVGHITVIYALARLGVVMLPMDVRWNEEEKQRLVTHFKPAAVIVEPGAEELSGCRCLSIDTVAGEVLADEAADDAPMAAGPDLPLLMSLSSGTTGRPKGPRITHEQMLCRFRTHWINLGFNADDRYVSATPLYFGGGRTFAMSVLFAGGTLVLFPPPFKVHDLPPEIERVKATSIFLVPTQLRKLLEEDASVLDAMSSLRLLISSGAPLFPQERVEIRERICPNLIEYYASTEGGGVSISKPADQLRHGDSVGRAIFAVDIEIVGEDHAALPAGQIGRLRYRGPGVATAYFNDEEASRDAFRDGWFYPGDLAERNEDGFVFLRGRAKDMIIRGGVNIHPGEVEEILSTHPQVSEAAVVGRPSKVLGEEVAAFVIAKGKVEPAELIAWCKERLAPYKVPVEVILRDGLPKNSSGKVLKKDLVALFAAE